MVNTNLSVEQLESSLRGNDDDSSDDDFDQENVTKNNERSGKARQMILQCLQCNKDFDSSQINADVATSLCSICNTTSLSNKFPEYQSRTENNTDAVVPELVDDDEEPDIEKLPIYQDAYQQGEIPDYTGFKDSTELEAHFIAGGHAGDGNTLALIIGNLGIQEFTKSRHPDAYGISGKDAFWRFVKDPYEREKELVMYGYDLYDAIQCGEVAHVCNCMIIGHDGFPTGQILYKIGRTRCPNPRSDGFIYDIRENK